MVTRHQKEEILESCWELRERDRPITVGDLPAVNGVTAETIVESLLAEGFLEQEGQDLSLTAKGENTAATVVRRKRLAEVLLNEVLEVGTPHMESSACEMEHILSLTVTERICTFLGHPPRCPHGRPIPRGPCCAQLTKTMKPLVTSLANFDVGQEARIVFISPRSHERLDKLSSLGVIPGKTVRLHQKHPSFVIQVGETELALDTEIVREIYVRAL
jgi:DtxR family Mn-dependent transcriptional regulator